MSKHRVEEVDDNEELPAQSGYTVHEPDQADWQQRARQQQQHAQQQYDQQQRRAQREREQMRQRMFDPFANDPFFSRSMFGQSPFSSMFGNFGGFGSSFGFGGIEDDFETMGMRGMGMGMGMGMNMGMGGTGGMSGFGDSGGGRSTFYSSSSVSYSSGSGSKPIVIQKTSERINNNGLLQETSTERDSRIGLESIQLKRNVNGKEKTIAKKRIGGGSIETHETTHGVEQGEDFEQEWRRHTTPMISGHGSGSRNDPLLIENDETPSTHTPKGDRTKPKKKPTFK